MRLAATFYVPLPPLPLTATVTKSGACPPAPVRRRSRSQLAYQEQSWPSGENETKRQRSHALQRCTHASRSPMACLTVPHEPFRDLAQSNLPESVPLVRVRVRVRVGLGLGFGLGLGLGVR